jgi:DNA-binding response OmpR family regulator
MAYKILVIDDEPDVVKYLISVLEDNGYDVISATDSVRGLEMAEKQSPDLICLDIMMPKKSGISIYRSIRAGANTCTIPVIILTGIEKGDSFDFHTWVGDDQIPPPELFMEKPIQVAGFLESVAGAINAKKADTQ